jgi:Fe-S-cluster containining protein
MGLWHCGMHDMDEQFRQVWLAAQDPTVTARLEAIYAKMSEEIAARGPACWASGRCCNFRKAGHDLFVTLLEAAYCVQRANRDAELSLANINVVPDQHTASTRKDLSLPQASSSAGAGANTLSIAAIDAARERGDCPYLEGNLCGAHGTKPLGCRVYFCDATAQDWQHELTERALRDIRALHEQFNVPYVYDEWRRQLTRCVSPAR